MGTTGVTGFSFPHDTLAVVPGGQIKYTSDDAQQQQGTFEAVIRTAGTGGIDLSSACLTRTGISLSCEMVATALTEFAAMAAMTSVNPGILCTDGPDQPATCQFFFSYQNISCVPISPGSPDNACHCTYDVSFAGSLHGRWLRSGALLTHSDASRTLPSQADYCVDGSGGSLTLWGHDRTSIFGQTGVRTLQLSRAP